MFRVLFVTQVVLDDPMGAPRHVIALARELARLGLEVTLLAPGALDVPGVRRLRPPAGLTPGLRMESALAALAAKDAILHRPDVAYVRISASSSAVPLALAALRVPLVTELNGRILDELEERGRSPQAIALVETNLRVVARLSKTIVAVAETVAEHALQRLGAREVSIVLNGADLDVAQPGDREEAKATLELPPLRMLTMVGSLAPELRLDLLAEAHRTLSGTALLVVGDGPGAPFIQAMRAATRPSSPVLFLGKRPHPEAIAAIRAAHVCINVRDGDIGMRGLEYAAVGRRQVAFDSPDAERLADLYPPELKGVILVRERSSAALKAGILEAFEAEAQGPLPPDAVAAARETLGWDHTARQIAQLLEEAAQS